VDVSIIITQVRVELSEAHIVVSRGVCNNVLRVSLYWGLVLPAEINEPSCNDFAVTLSVRSFRLVFHCVYRPRPNYF